ncbi:MAG: hypothetical protein AAGA12_13285 [Pseudomonadota bacterium]
MTAAIRIALGVLALGLLVIAANQVAQFLLCYLEMEQQDAPSGGLRSMIYAGAVFYALVLAVPFVPGAEIGLMMLSLFGASVAPLVYLATVAGLSLAYWIGRIVPTRIISATLRWLQLTRAAELIETNNAKSPEARIRAMLSKAKTSWMPFLIRHRYIALALALNIPGNVLIGGGGGIAMIAGMSRFFAPLPTLAAIAIGVLPVPAILIIYAGM